MTRIATTVKETYAKEYQEFNEVQRNDYDRQSLLIQEECLLAFEQYAKEYKMSDDEIINIKETIRENIIIESMYANPDDPQKVVSIARTKINTVLKILFENTNHNIREPQMIFDFINQNSGSNPIKEEQEEALKIFRFIIKYVNIGRKDEQLQ